MSRTSPDLLAEAVFDIAATRGLDAASIREVATAARVSIGAVQHHFATKDELYTFAFDHLVRRVRARVARVDPAAPLPDRLIAVLSQLLPLDAEREREGRVMLAFAARAATSSTLAAIQRRTLDEIRHQLAEQLADHSRTHAGLLLAAVDGLTLNALSSGSYRRAELRSALAAQVRLVTNCAVSGDLQAGASDE